jgi:hypothetical protein
VTLLVRLLAALLLLGVLLAPSAAAVDAGRVADQLADDPLLVDPRSAVRIDDPAVRDALDDVPVPTYVVVLPQDEVDRDENGIDGILLEVVEALDDPRAVVVVVSDGGELQAGEGGASGVDASALLDRIVQERSDQEFDGTALTGALLAFADAVSRDADEGAERGLSGSGRRTVGVAGLVAVAVVGGGVLWQRSQRRVRRSAPLTDAETDSGGW